MVTPNGISNEHKTNYVAYTTAETGPRIGHLDLDKQEITPLSFASGTPLTSLYEVIEAGEVNIASAGAPFIASSVRLLPPLSGRDVLAVGKNYADHAKEFNASGFDSSDKTDQPTHPVIFTKRATSIVAHGDLVLVHDGFTESVDYEGEIGMIVGKPGFRISEENAMDHVWGFTIINDVTARERQRDHKQFYIGKSPDTYCPMGPIAVPKEHLPEKLRVQTFVNGEKRQDGTLDMLIFSLRFLIKTLSEGQTLQLGDVLATGTPAGVGFGFQPAKFLKPGDEVNVSVTGLGNLVNKIAEAGSKNPTIDSVSNHSYVPVINRILPSSGLTRIGEKSLFYQCRGLETGNPVLFIHGLGGTSTYFSLLESRLKSSRALHFFDLEGHGLSPTSASSVLSIDSFAKDVAELCKHAKITHGVEVVAHSMGCLVALKFVLSKPDLISRLILLGPPPSPLPAAGQKGSIARAQTVREKGMPGVADAVANAGTSESTKKHNPLALAATKLSLQGQDPESYAKACTALAGSANDTLEVAKILVPTLILTGSDDAVSTPETCRKYAAQIKGASVKVLENVGHWHLFENVEETVEAVTSFLQA